MDYLPLFRRFVTLMFCLVAVTGYDMIQLRSGFGRHRTSSTLLWKPFKSGKGLPFDAVPVDKSYPRVAWCRAELSGLSIPGEVEGKGKCKVAFIGKEPNWFDKFDVLISLNGSARIKLKLWDSFQSKPDNALQSPDRILAAFEIKGSKRLLAAHIGTGSYDRNALVVSEDDRVMQKKSAFILIEDEPLRYSLTNIWFDPKLQSEKRDPILLNETVLVNEGEDTMEVTELLPYEIEESQYWGRAKGTITSLETVVQSPTGHVTDIIWGTESPFFRVEFGKVFYELPPKSSVKVTLMGSVRTFESNYKGDLEAFYSDKFTTTRNIETLHIEKTLITVIAKYEQPRHLDTLSAFRNTEEISKLVFERTTTTTTTSTTTTTPSTTLSTTPEPTTEEATTVEPSTEELATVNDLFEDDDRTIENVLQTGSLSKYHDNQNRPNERATTSDPTKNAGSTSDRLLTGLSTIFTALVFWYFSLGA